MLQKIRIKIKNIIIINLNEFLLNLKTKKKDILIR